MRYLTYILAGVFFTLVPVLSTAAEPSPPTQPGPDSQVRDLKKSALELNRDLLLLQDELLTPSASEFSVFLSLKADQSFAPNSVKLKLDGKNVSDYQYTRRDIDALEHGGVQRLHTGSLGPGEHELAAVVAGKGTRGRDLEINTTARITKGPGPKYVELRIVNRTGILQPELEIREW
jgi:hypothetical protein